MNKSTTILGLTLFSTAALAADLGTRTHLDETKSDRAASGSIYTIDNPSHYGSHLSFFYGSDANGVCKYLGYEKAVKNSIKDEGRSENQPLLVLDENGKVNKVKNHNWAIKAITCVKRVDSPFVEGSALILNPKIGPDGTALRFSTRSSAQGICKHFGFEGGGAAVADYAQDSEQTINIRDDESVSVDLTQRVVSQIACFSSSKTLVDEQVKLTSRQIALREREEARLRHQAVCDELGRSSPATIKVNGVEYLREYVAAYDSSSGGFVCALRDTNDRYAAAPPAMSRPSNVQQYNQISRRIDELRRTRYSSNPDAEEIRKLSEALEDWMSTPSERVIKGIVKTLENMDR